MDGARLFKKEIPDLPKKEQERMKKLLEVAPEPPKKTEISRKPFTVNLAALMPDLPMYS